MANLYKRTDSCFYWITYRDAAGATRQESTRLRHENPVEVRKARALEAQRTADELARGASATVGRRRSKGWLWVQPFLDVRYHTNGTTLERYTDCWRTLIMFLTERKIESPMNLIRQNCFDYMAWREKAEPKKGKYRARHNTALLELKILRIVMQEAVERGLAQGNPCVKLGIKRDEQKIKPELTQEHVDKIRAGIPLVLDPAVRQMLANSFEIARFQGCRITETRLDPRKDVDLETMEIAFRAKGKKDHVTALHPSLVPLFKRLRKEGKAFTWEIPAGRGRQWASAHWFRFLHKIGLKADGVTHHCNRITVISEMARNNVSEAKAQKFVGHSSTLVHRIYQRLRPKDLSECVAAIASGDKPS